MRPTRVEAVEDRFPEEEDTNLLFNCFDVSNERIISREAEMRGFAVECGERLFRGGG